MDHRTIRCSCNWARDIRSQDWGVMAGKDYMLDLHSAHKKNAAEVE